MAIYITLAIIIIILIGIGIMLWLRTSKRNLITETEQRKKKIKQLPFQDELAKLKKLNVHGEAKDKYDQFKREWQTVLNEDLKVVDAKIHDADAELDKFKFSQSEESIADANKVMDGIEKKYTRLTQSVTELMTSVENSDQLYNESKQIYRETKREVLANRHQFGDAAGLIEKNIEAFLPRLEQYEELVEEGHYIKASGHIDQLNTDMKRMQEDMEEIPLLIKDVQKELPGQFQDLKFGCRDLKVEGYNLEHVKVEGTLQTLRGKLNLVEPLIGRLELSKAENLINEINDSLDDMYDLIEHEVKSKNTVEQSKEIITDELFHAKDMNYTLQTEIEYVKENYYISEEDVHKVRQYENEIQNLISVYDEILGEMAKTNVRYSEVEDNLLYIEEHVKVINDNQEKIQNHLISLREDEATAQQNTLRVQSKKEEIYRNLLASNLPSVPERFIIMKNEIDHEIREVNKIFSQRPINVQYVKDKVSNIVLQMNKFEDETTDVLINAVHAETLIQYGNRYRKENNELNKSLNEAERLFANNRYKRAIEIAETALDKVEPGISVKIEEDVHKQS